MNTISRSRRSLFTQLRLGILPLEIEAGRFTPIYDKSIKKNRKRHPSERLCKLCNMKICEDEIHFMLICPMYEHARQYLIKHVLKIYPCFNSLSSIEKLKLLMQHYQFQSLTYIKQAWDIRQQNLHSCYQYIIIMLYSSYVCACMLIVYRYTIFQSRQKIIRIQNRWVILSI